MVVQHNLSAMNANRMLGITTSGQSKSSEKLSSGYKINRAADDAAGLSISEKMRKQVRGLTRASVNAQDGISAVQTAEGALNEVHSMLQRMNELAVQAANGTNSESDRQSIQDEVDQLITEIDRVSETTKFNETYLLKGDTAGERKLNFQYQAATVLNTTLWYKEGSSWKSVNKGDYASSLNTAYSYYTSTAEADAQVGEAVTAGETANYFTTANILSTDYYTKSGSTYALVKAGSTFNSSGTYYTIDFSGTQEIYSAVASTALQTAVGYFVKSATLYDEDGKKYGPSYAFGQTAPTYTDYFKNLGVAENPDGAVTDLSKYYASTSVQLTDADGNEVAANGLYSYMEEDGTYKQGSGLYIKEGTKLKEATSKDVEALVSSKPYEIGALKLKLHVGADATANNQISLSIDAMSADSIGVKGLSVAGKDDTNSLNAIETISAALKRVSEQRSSLGAIQNRLEHTISNLDNVVENTTAAESRIRDTDMAKEMVEYSKNNILAQAGQSMLAQANQSTQGVLSILG